MSCNNIFADIVDLHPSRVAVFTNNGELFYANGSYKKAYRIDLFEQENIHFDKIKPHLISFEELQKRLSVSSGLTLREEEEATLLESLFFYTANSSYLIHIRSNITTLKEVDKRVYYHANHDSLTALPNRSFFKRKLKETLENTAKSMVQTALFFIDIDKFKEVNDIYGHNIGDKMLITIAKRLLNSVRENDIIARIGGDEFVLIAKDISHKRVVEEIARKLQKKIKEPIKIDKHLFNISLSIGIALYPEHAKNSSELLKNADVAMYEVKKEKRGGFKIYERSMSSRAEKKFLIRSEIKKALQNKEFVMHYQPVIDFKTDQVIGAEALVRWHHRKKGVLQPQEFLRFLLSTEMEKDFGCMVVSTVFQDIRNLNMFFLDKKFKVSLNISKEQFFSPYFSSDIAAIAKDSGIDASRIELKIVEGEIMQNASVAKKNIQNLHASGFPIVLDDFGIEHSSLRYLKNLEVQKLKIDRSLIKGFLADQDDMHIVRSIIEIAKLFGLKVQAEGIETQEQYVKLKDMGCDFSQGFYHAEALPIDEFISYFNKNPII